MNNKFHIQLFQTVKKIWVKCS